MYWFANFLLLALFAAAVLDGVAALRRERIVRAAFAGLWGGEHFLFGQWAGARRAALGQWLFVAAVALYELNVTLCNSMARENWPLLQAGLAPLLDLAFCALVGGKVLLCTRYTWKSLGTAGCLYFIARWVFFNSQNIWWLGIVLVVLAAKDVPLRRPLQAYLLVGGAVMAMVAALHFAGIVSPGLLSERAGEFREAYGYGHPNTFGGLFFGLVLAFALLRAKNIRWGDIALIAAAGVFLLLGPASRSAALCTLLLAVLLAAWRLAPKLFSRRAVPLLGAGLLPALAALSFLLPLPLYKIGPWNNDFAPLWLGRLNNLLTGRLSMIWVAYRMYDVKIAGQVLMDWPALDNAYAYTLYQFGPVVAVLVGVLMVAAVWGLLRARRVPEALCLIVMIAYSFMEVQGYHFTSNPTALLLAGVLYALPADRWPARE